MALGVNFPENEDVVAFGRKNEMLVLLVSILGMCKKWAIMLRKVN